MRLGFLLGFLIGGAIASVVARTQEEEVAEVAGQAREALEAQVNPVVGRIRHQVGEAKEAAHEAQLEKEAEMLREYEDLIHRTPPANP